jgi:hypothetical protein
MMGLLATLKSKIVQRAGAIFVALSVLFGLFQYGRKTQRDDNRVEDMEDYIETKKRIENVQNSPDRDAALERMRRNGWL